VRRSKERLDGGGKWCPDGGMIPGELWGSLVAPVGRGQGGKDETCQQMRRRGRR
jgi:hypothetical protein